MHVRPLDKIATLLLLSMMLQITLLYVQSLLKNVLLMHLGRDLLQTLSAVLTLSMISRC